MTDRKAGDKCFTSEAPFVTVQYRDTDRDYENKLRVIRLTWKRHDTTCQSPGDIEHNSVTHINTILTIHTQTAKSVEVTCKIITIALQ